MSDVVKFTAECQDFNRRLYAKQTELAAMVEEREILIEQSRGNGIMTGHARKMLGKLAFTITMPEGYQPPAPTPDQPAAGPIVRHDDDKAA